MKHHLLDRIDQRTRLAGHNRLALLLFRLHPEQILGINVFKVQEVLSMPALFHLPSLPAAFAGAADVRGKTVPVVNLADAIKMGDAATALEPGYLIVTEFNRQVQGFRVGNVERIVNIAVEEIQPPPSLGNNSRYLTGITRYQGQLIQLVDLESVLADAMPQADDSGAIQPIAASELIGPSEILVVDDSRVARNQIQSVIAKLGLDATLLSDGQQALDHLESLIKQGIAPTDRYAMVISDIEMPCMDGYTLTTRIRANPELRELHVILHTSLSGVFNHAMVERVGADDFVPKFSQNELAQHIRNHVTRALAA